MESRFSLCKKSHEEIGQIAIRFASRFQSLLHGSHHRCFGRFGRLRGVRFGCAICARLGQPGTLAGDTQISDSCRRAFLCLRPLFGLESTVFYSSKRTETLYDLLMSRRSCT